MNATEFRMIISAVDLVDWGDDSINGQRTELSTIFKIFNANIDVTKLVDDYFEDCERAGKGDVHVFQKQNNHDFIFAIDFYNEPSDQLDLVEVFFRFPEDSILHISEILSTFFNRSSAQILYSQATFCMRLNEALNPNNFPRNVKNYVQQQVIHFIK